MSDQIRHPPADVSVQLIRALQNVWNAIRVRHPDVPGVVLLPAPALRRGVLGHFAPLRWVVREAKGTLLHEVVVVAEHMDRSAADIVETLLHEAAHAMNFARGINDCSRSQYHNKRFKAAADEVGLEVEQVRHYGFALTSMPELTKQAYQRVTDELQAVLIHRREFRPHKPTAGNDNGRATTTTAGGTATPSRSRKATCRCGFIIRVSRKTIEDTTIRCDRCGGPFQLA